MDLVQSVVLGIVQGLTEFLPISSTAHLRVLPALLGWGDPGVAWSAVVQLGTLLAVLIYFFRDLVSMLGFFFLGLVKFRPLQHPQSRLTWILIVGTAPIVAAGLLFEDAIESSLRSLWVVAGALAGLAVLLAFAEWVGSRRRKLWQIGLPDGLFVGVAQALALIPGASRSGVTITAGLLAGINRADAARLSFLFSIPAVGASGIYQLSKLLESDLGAVPWRSVVLGAVSAFLAGYLAIAFLIRFLERRSTLVFVSYRLLLAGAIAVLLLTGTISP